LSEEKILKAEAAEQVLSMCRRLAQLYIAFARTLVEELGREKGKSLIREAIFRYGQEIGKKIRERVEAEGQPLTMENFRKFSDLPSLAFSPHSFDTEGGRVARIDHCVLASVWKELGEEELGRLYCYMDQAKMEAYNPDFEYIHLKNCLDSDISYCDTTIQKKKKPAAS
jgi:hypothetical protein